MMPSETLMPLLLSITPDGLANGMDHCVKRAEEGNEWPPAPMAFMALCKKPIDFEEAFLRMVKRQAPKNDAEIMARREAGWSVKNQSEQQANKVFQRAYSKFYTMLTEGCLPDPNQKKLPPKVVTTEFDRLRDQAIRDGKYRPRGSNGY